jgi:hypothetical protein
MTRLRLLPPIVPFLLVALWILSGCATIFKGTKEDVEFGSSPDNTAVYVNGSKIGMTPCKVMLRSKGEYTVEFKKEGYQNKVYHISSSVGTTWVILDVLAGAAIPILTDVATGSWYILDETNIFTQLEASKDAMQPSPGVDSSRALLQAAKLLPTQLPQKNQGGQMSLAKGPVVATKQGLWPGKGTVAIEANALFDFADTKFLGKEINDITHAEDVFLKSMGLIVTTKSQTGEILSTTVIDKYDYPTPLCGNIRALYFLNDYLALGIHVTMYQYEQKLSVEGTDYKGYLAQFTSGSFCGNLFLWHDDKMGIEAKADFGFLDGTIERATALSQLKGSDISLTPSLISLIDAAHKSVKFEGVEASVGTTFDYMFMPWMGVNAGLHLYYLNASLDSQVWNSSQRSFNSLTLTGSIGLNFFLWNN